MSKDCYSKAVVVGPVRCNFVNITKDRAETCTNTKGEQYLKYGMQCIMPASCKAAFAPLLAAMTEVLAAKYGGVDKAPKNLKKPILLGSKKDTDAYPYYLGMRYFGTTAYPSKQAPNLSPIGIIDANGSLGLGEAPPLDGCYAMVKVTAKTYNPEKSQPGVSFRLEAVQPIPTAEAARRYAKMGYHEELDDSPLGGTRAPAAEGFGAFDDDGASRPENYEEAKESTDAMDLLGGDDDEGDDDLM